MSAASATPVRRSTRAASKRASEQIKKIQTPSRSRQNQKSSDFSSRNENSGGKTQRDEALPSVKKGSSWWINGFAGISAGGLFNTTPDWVDQRKSPGATDQTTQLGAEKTLSDVLCLRYFFMSPNLVWFSMALSMHFFFPYPIEEAKEHGFQASWMFRRFGLNFTVAFAYYAFFYVGLYCNDWASRKFRPGVYPTTGNMIHNLYYWTLAIVQWTWWECVMIKLWADGTVGYTTNEEVFSSPKEMIKTIGWILAIPLWRDLHFYIAHRFIHIRAVYKYVHSLHHRNADPEPFSGMTMHPVEHLYYFSNAFTPSLYLHLSPVVFLWNFIHLTIAPGAGHSGFEDHFQADQYHYVHHAKFECNYGSPFSAFIDQYFGTFRESLGKTKEYKGEWKEENNTTNTIRQWSPNGYLGLPASWDHALYSLFWAALFPVTWWGIVGNKTNDGQRVVAEWQGIPIPQVLGFVIAYSPVLIALVLAKVSGDRMSWRWPFQKEKVIGPFGFFLVLGWAACITPMYHAVSWVC